MSKPVKEMMMKAYEDRFAGLTGAVLVNTIGIESNDNNRLRADLAEKGVKITVIKNTLARKIFAGGDMEPANELMSGPTALVYPVDDDTSVVSVARELIDWAKQIEKLEFRGAVMDGITFGPKEIKKLSEYPTKEEAQAQVVQILLSPGQNLVGSVLGPGRKVASLVKAIQEKLEAGETIAKA